jgi:hypothetical protein
VLADSGRERCLWVRVVIEPTDEMRQAFRKAALTDTGFDADRGLAAVLAIVERDQAGPCSVALPLITAGGESCGDLWCELRHGHLGDHQHGPTRWKTLPPATPRTEVVAWGWREQFDHDRLAAAISRVSAGAVHAVFPDTGGSDYVLVLSSLPLTPEAAARLYHDQDGDS